MGVAVRVLVLILLAPLLMGPLMTQPQKAPYVKGQLSTLHNDEGAWFEFTAKSDAAVLMLGQQTLIPKRFDYEDGLWIYFAEESTLWSDGVIHKTPMSPPLI